VSNLSVVHTTADIRELVGEWRAAHEVVALVPTMGNLHDGHLSLAQLARETADRVVMSIYVNPTQFGVGEDFHAYPRTLAEDRELVEADATVDALFVPDDAEVYPFGTEQAVRLVMPAFANELCGAIRPGHFDGVSTVVCRLLNIVMPDSVMLGCKDYQQLKVVERLVADLHLPVRVLSGPTRRHADGLAISSRNRYLTSDQRRHAPVLHATLEDVKAALQAGQVDYRQLEGAALTKLRAEGFNPDYVEVRQARDLARPNGQHAPGELVVLAAAWLGKARLIDNLRV
jgi:pantoate--beta-alanine ligase